MNSNVLRDALKVAYDKGANGEDVWSSLSDIQKMIEQKQ